MSELITLDKFKNAIMSSMKTPAMREQAAVGLAEHVLNFFGFQDRIIDNMLDPEDRDAFYMLEDVGLLTTEREETGLPDGREWRIHYWLIREDKITKALKASNQKGQRDHGEKDSVYDTIPDDIWFRRGVAEAEEEVEDEDEDELTEDDWETPILPSDIPVNREAQFISQVKKKAKPASEEELEGEEKTKYVSEESGTEESEEE